MHSLGAKFLPVLLIGLAQSHTHSDALPDSGASKFAAYQVCRSLAAIDMGDAGSGASFECNGIVKAREGQNIPGNQAIRCLEATNARPDGYSYSGSCVQTDHDGDKLYMTYEGSKGGEVKWIGGTGKYEDVRGTGTLNVEAAPKSSDDVFAFTLNYDVTWTNKGECTPRIVGGECSKP